MNVGFALCLHDPDLRISEELLHFSGLAYVRAENASIIALLEPISAVVFAAIILSPLITLTILEGGALILLSALMVSGKRGMEAAHK